MDDAVSTVDHDEALPVAGCSGNCASAIKYCDIKEEAERRGFNASSLAKKSGVSAMTIGAIFNGTGNPRYSTLVKVAEALDVVIDI